jgi:uncharacterized protein
MTVARVAVGTVELHLPDVDSLKGKRHVLKGLKEKVRARFEVSVAEVDHQDTWQRAAIAVAVVAESDGHLRDILATVERTVANAPDVELLDTETVWLDADGASLEEA